MNETLFAYIVNCFLPSSDQEKEGEDDEEGEAADCCCDDDQHLALVRSNV